VVERKERMHDVLAEEGMLMGRSYNYATSHLEEFGKLKKIG